MSDIEISVDAGTSKRLLTAGKYCDRDILVSASGGAVSPVIEPLEVTTNGTYTAPAGVDGYSPVTVNVSGSGVGETGGSIYINHTRTLSEVVIIFSDNTAKFIRTFADVYQEGDVLNNVLYFSFIQDGWKPVVLDGDCERIFYDDSTLERTSVYKINGDCTLSL